MNVLFLLIPVALVLVAGGVAGFWWATRDGQFDDLDTPAVRILLDENHHHDDVHHHDDEAQ